MSLGRATDMAEADGPPSTVEAYQSVILSAITPLAPARLELAAAEGCVLAEDVTAAVALPSFDNSSMDGYAVCATDVAGAAQQAPVMLRVTGEIAAGDVGAYRLVPGTAIKIMTGARLPAGADAVVPVEWTDGGVAEVAVYQPAKPGNAVRYVGGDAAEGETLLSAGTRMRPMQVAVAASAGRKAVGLAVAAGGRNAPRGSQPGNLLDPVTQTVPRRESRSTRDRVRSTSSASRDTRASRKTTRPPTRGARCPSGRCPRRRCSRPIGRFISTCCRSMRKGRRRSSKRIQRSPCRYT